MDTRVCHCFQESYKQSLSSDSVLAHYDLQLPLYLAGDAPCYGISAVEIGFNPEKIRRKLILVSLESKFFIE